jgi:hypothetical protein
VINQRAQRPRLVPIVQRLLPRVRLAHVVAQRAGLGITRTAMHHGTVDRALLVAHQVCDAIVLQLQGVSLRDVALKLLLVRIQRHGHLDLCKRFICFGINRAGVGATYKIEAAESIRRSFGDFCFSRVVAGPLLRLRLLLSISLASIGGVFSKGTYHGLESLLAET